MEMKEYKMKTYPGNHERILVTEDFVLKNNFTLARTQEEILERFKEKSGGFDCEPEVLIEYLPFDVARDFYTEEYRKKVESGEVEYTCITDIYEATQDMLDYLVFGYMKALDERGLSAGRTIHKLGAWFWLLGRDDLRRIVNDDELYNPYGMPALLEVTKLLGLPVHEDCVEFAKHKCA